MTLRRRCTILPGLPHFLSRGNTPIGRKRHHVATDDGGAALLYHQMLSVARIQSDNRGRGGGDNQETTGSRVDCPRRSQCRFVGHGRTGTVQIDSGGGSVGGIDGGIDGGSDGGS